MKKRVKGFTLIELIVVMAVFAIIMFGALQLIPSVLKMMVQADVHEGGNAAVSSISNYLESELSTAEYLYATDTMPVINDKGGNELELADKSMVREFVERFYEGVLRDGARPASPQYGKGKVHVLLIDNNNNGRISEIVYRVSDFGIGVTDADIVYESSSMYAVNKAYYDTYQFEILCGTYDESGFDLTDPVDYQNFVNSLSNKNTAFSIRATTNRNNTDYSFVTNSTMSLVNLYNNRATGGVPTGTYYVVTEETEGGSIVPYIVDISKGYGVAQTVTSYDTVHTNSRKYGKLTEGKIINYVGGTNDGYCFIYSYGSEIETD